MEKGEQMICASCEKSMTGCPFEDDDEMLCDMYEPMYKGEEDGES